MPWVWCGTEEEIPPGVLPVSLWFSREELDTDLCYRASGECLCPACGRTYWDHPYALEQWNLSFEGSPFLRRLCNGHAVKL